MEKNFKIFIISYKRAGGVTSDKVFNDAYIVVPSSQYEEYAEHEYENGCRLLEIADEHDGNIVRKRNWILDTYEGNIIIVDDDYKCIELFQGGKRKKLTPNEIDEFIDNGCRMCEEMGTVMWGLNVNDGKQNYDEYVPFNMTGVVLGPFQGFCNLPSDIRYDERVYLKEDYDISLQVLQRYHKILKFKKYHYIVNHINKAGGVVSYRTMEKELEHNKRLQEKWGDKVIRFNMDKSINPIVKAPLRGI